MSGLIYHITKKSLWSTALEDGVYSADSLASEGFIHCSSNKQVERVANLLYKGQRDLVLLEIEPSRLKNEIRWEPGSDDPNEKYPHVYGSLNLEAITRVVDLHANEGGSFTIPLP